MTTAVDARGLAVHYTYNAQGEVTGIDFADGAFVKVYLLDPKTGQVATATDATGTTALQYDPLTGLLTSVTYPDGQSLSYTTTTQADV